VLVPTATGYDVIPAGWTGGLGGLDAAVPPATIPLDRDGGTGRIDAAAVGSMVVEDRGGTVVGLSP
jgi:hypothetical protein